MSNRQLDAAENDRRIRYRLDRDGDASPQLRVWLKEGGDNAIARASNATQYAAKQAHPGASLAKPPTSAGES